MNDTTKVESILDELADICKKHHMDISACSCTDTCDGISISIKTKSGYFQVDHLGINSNGQFTNGNSWLIKPKDIILKDIYKI